MKKFVFIFFGLSFFTSSNAAQVPPQEQLLILFEDGVFAPAYAHIGSKQWKDKLNLKDECVKEVRKSYYSVYEQNNQDYDAVLTAYRHVLETYISELMFDYNAIKNFIENPPQVLIQSLFLSIAQRLGEAAEEHAQFLGAQDYLQDLIGIAGYDDKDLDNVRRDLEFFSAAFSDMMPHEADGQDDIQDLD